MKGLTKVKVLLRSRVTGHYFSGVAGWSNGDSVAHDFEEVECAENLARTQKLADVEVVLRYEDPPCDLVLPLRPEPS